MSALAVAEASLKAYVDKDRSAVEVLLADDVRFTSPLDHALDRDAYLRICWLNSTALRSAHIVHGAESDIASLSSTRRSGRQALSQRRDARRPRRPPCCSRSLFRLGSAAPVPVNTHADPEKIGTT